MNENLPNTVIQRFCCSLLIASISSVLETSIGDVGSADWTTTEDDDEDDETEGETGEGTRRGVRSTERIFGIS